jgi:uncharacterized protein (DUF302 family)
MDSKITRTAFVGQLVTIRTTKSFDEVTAKIERMFQRYEADKLRALTAAGDVTALAAYARHVGNPTGFGIFYQLDMGSLMRLGGVPIESRLYLIGSTSTGVGLFQYSAAAALGAPTRFCVSQRDGDRTRIDIDLPSAFFSQFPELSESEVPAELDARMLPLLEMVAG